MTFSVVPPLPNDASTRGDYEFEMARVHACKLKSFLRRMELNTIQESDPFVTDKANEINPAA